MLSGSFPNGRASLAQQTNQDLAGPWSIVGLIMSRPRVERLRGELSVPREQALVRL